MDMPQEMQGESQEMTICIKRDANGQFSVGENPAMQGEMPNMDGMESSEDYGDMTPAQDIEDALTMARQMLTADDRSQDQQVMDGYNKAKPAMPSKPTPQAVFGDV